MPEPSSSTAAGAVAGWKLVGGAAGVAGIGVVLAFIVVACMRLPKTAREWAVALISTLMCSLGLGAVVVVKGGLLGYVSNMTSDTDVMLAVAGGIGIIFACGLPGWAAVRWAFLWIERQEGKDAAEVLAGLRK